MNNETNERTPEVKPSSSLARLLAACKKGIRKIQGPLADTLGIDSTRRLKPDPDTTSATTLLAHERTDLALERTYWAAGRTLMGWIRTALSMISFGFTIGKLGQTLQDSKVMGLGGMRTVGISSIAYFLVILGTAALLAAAVQYSRRVHKLAKEGLQPQPSIEFWVSIVLSLMGIVAFSTLVLHI
jgi:putative membrane protein